MLELRQIISNINFLEAQNRQFDNRKKMGYPIPLNEYKSNEVKLEELYCRKGQLMQNIDITEPQYQM